MHHTPPRVIDRAVVSRVPRVPISHLAVFISLSVSVAGCGADDGFDAVAPGTDDDAAVCTSNCAPLYAPRGGWGFSAIEGTTCGKGGQAGVFINRSMQDSRRLVIYLEGGGACWDTATCAGTTNVVKFTLPFDYLLGFPNGAGKQGIFNRGITANPFRQDNFVYVPYCTGDLHAGLSTAVNSVDGVRHAGAYNLSLILARLDPTFRGKIDEVVVVGSSAGGYGAVNNYNRIKAVTNGTMGAKKTHLLVDGAPGLKEPAFPQGIVNSMYSAYNLRASTNCSTCSTLRDLFDRITPGVGERVGLVASEDDPILRDHFMKTNACDYATGMDALRYSFDQRPASTRSYLVTTIGHTYLDSDLFLTQTKTCTGTGCPTTSLRLLTWLQQFADGSTSWRNSYSALPGTCN